MSFGLLAARLLHVLRCNHTVSSELKDPIWHSLEWQIGSFSSEATVRMSTIFIYFRSDHSSFIATLNETAKLCQPKEKINYRCYSKFDFDNFKNDLTNSDLIQSSDTNSVTSLYTQYHDTVSTLLDKHAPLKCCMVTPNARPVNEWKTDEILSSKRKNRQLERIWWRGRTDSNRSRLNAQVHLCNRLMSKAKRTIIQIWFQITSQTLENYETKWNTFCIKKQTIYFRIVHAIPNLPALSMIFFISKIAKIRDTLMSAKPDSNIHPEPTPLAAPNTLLTSCNNNNNNNKCTNMFVYASLARMMVTIIPRITIFTQGYNNYCYYCTIRQVYLSL